MQTTFTNSGQLSPPENSSPRTKRSKIGFALGAALVGALTGCAGYVDGPRHTAYVEPTPVYVRSAVAQDDYIYYPSYQVYYSSNRRQYIYQDGRSWVSRRSPPRVSADVLFASPSVRLDFHDYPSIHHASVVQQYPKHWAPPGWDANRGRGNRDFDKDKNHGKGNDRGGRR